MCPKDQNTGNFLESEFTESKVEKEDSECLYIYKHGEYFAYSSVNMTKVAGFCRIEEDKGLLKSCRNTECHQHYLPYFYSNDQCRVLIEDPSAELSTFLNEGKFGDDKFVGDYDEDDWTHRLYCCLQIEKIDVEYTADLRGYQTNKSLKRRIPDVVSSNSLLFRGSPDLIIKAKKENNDEGLVYVDSLDDPPLLFMGYFYLQIKKMELKFKKFIPGNFVLHCYLILYCNNTV